MNEILEFHLSGLKTKILPQLDSKLENLYSNLINKAFDQTEQKVQNIKLENQLEGLRISLKSHITTSQQSQSEERKKFEIFERVSLE